MKRIYLNLKRFDIPPKYAGVNCLSHVESWANDIIANTQDALLEFKNTQFVQFFPEAHIISAVAALKDNSPVQIGCQSVYREDTQKGVNFGAFTSNRTANAMKALSCSHTIIGHCEERRDKMGVLQEAGLTDFSAVNMLLNKEIKCAVKAGMEVLYCIGESAQEQPHWEETLLKQLTVGLDGVDLSKICIAYEPVWAIGPGKTPPGRDYIQKIATFIKKEVNVPVVYGGGLKLENAQEIGSIDEIDGGLIALTRFTGEIGFYPDEYLAIIKCYLGKYMEPNH